MQTNQVILRCQDGQEAVVFTKYTYNTVCSMAAILDPDSISYEICIEDDYIGGDYKGFFGRLKRAWKAFTGKPVIYTGIYCEDKEKMRKFLADCISLVVENDDNEIEEDFEYTNEEPFLKGLYGDK